jgi:hypothetical protein
MTLVSAPEKHCIRRFSYLHIPDSVMFSLASCISQGVREIHLENCVLDSLCVEDGLCALTRAVTDSVHLAAFTLRAEPTIEWSERVDTVNYNILRLVSEGLMKSKSMERASLHIECLVPESTRLVAMGIGAIANNRGTPWSLHLQNGADAMCEALTAFPHAFAVVGVDQRFPGPMVPSNGEDLKRLLHILTTNTSVHTLDVRTNVCMHQVGISVSALIAANTNIKDMVVRGRPGWGDDSCFSIAQAIPHNTKLHTLDITSWDPSLDALAIFMYSMVESNSNPLCDIKGIDWNVNRACVPDLWRHDPLGCLQQATQSFRLTKSNPLFELWAQSGVYVPTWNISFENARDVDMVQCKIDAHDESTMNRFEWEYDPSGMPMPDWDVFGVGEDSDAVDSNAMVEDTMASVWYALLKTT